MKHNPLYNYLTECKSGYETKFKSANGRSVYYINLDQKLGTNYNDFKYKETHVSIDQYCLPCKNSVGYKSLASLHITEVHKKDDELVKFRAYYDKNGDFLNFTVKRYKESAEYLINYPVDITKYEFPIIKELVSSLHEQLEKKQQEYEKYLTEMAYAFDSEEDAQVISGIIDKVLKSLNQINMFSFEPSDVLKNLFTNIKKNVLNKKTVQAENKATIIDVQPKNKKQHKKKSVVRKNKQNSTITVQVISQICNKIKALKDESSKFILIMLLDDLSISCDKQQLSQNLKDCVEATSKVRTEIVKKLTDALEEVDLEVINKLYPNVGHSIDNDVIFRVIRKCVDKSISLDKALWLLTYLQDNDQKRYKMLLGKYVSFGHNDQVSLVALCVINDNAEVLEILKKQHKSGSPVIKRTDVLFRFVKEKSHQSDLLRILQEIQEPLHPDVLSLRHYLERFKGYDSVDVAKINSLPKSFYESLPRSLKFNLMKKEQVSENLATVIIKYRKCIDFLPGELVVPASNSTACLSARLAGITKLREETKKMVNGMLVTNDVSYLEQVFKQDNPDPKIVQILSEQLKNVKDFIYSISLVILDYGFACYGIDVDNNSIFGNAGELPAGKKSLMYSSKQAGRVFEYIEIFEKYLKESWKSAGKPGRFAVLNELYASADKIINLKKKLRRDPYQEITSYLFCQAIFVLYSSDQLKLKSVLPVKYMELNEEIIKTESLGNKVCGSAKAINDCLGFTFGLK